MSISSRSDLFTEHSPYSLVQISAVKQKNTTHSVSQGDLGGIFVPGV